LTPPSARETAAPAVEMLALAGRRSRGSPWCLRPVCIHRPGVPLLAVAVQPATEPQIIRMLATDRSVNSAAQKPLALT